jgi:hypothetical protein
MIDSSTRSLVYGYVPHHETLAFADGATAAEEAREIVAIASSRTFGEARRVEVRHVGWNPADPEYSEDHDDAPFDITELGAVVEGDWPSMVASRATDLLPKDLQQRFGTPTDTVLNGDYLTIPATAEAELVAALQERGYEVRRDDDLINTLNGATFISFS